MFIKTQLFIYGGSQKLYTIFLLYIYAINLNVGGLLSATS